MRYRISRRDPPAPVWSATPAPSFTQGVSASYSLSSISSDPGSQPLTYTSVGAAFPVGITINNVTKTLDYNGGGTPATTTGLRLRASNGAASSDSALFSLTIAASGAVVDLTTFQITSDATAPLRPWTFGHAFKQGDVPTGTYLVTNESEFQAAVQNRWPDGSVKFAVISGRTTLTTNVPHTMTLRRTATAPTGINVTLADLRANFTGTNTVALGAFGTVNLTTLIAGAPFRSWISGPQMSEWHWRSAVGSDAHLVVWAHVRYYAGGSTSIEVIVENGYMKVASPADNSYTATVTINGTTRYTGSISHYKRTRWATFNWFDGSNGLTDVFRVIPRHNPSYLVSTKIVPPYRTSMTVNANTLNALTQTITPMGVGDFASAGGSLAGAGYQKHIGLLPQWDAAYVISGDSRAYRSMVAHSYMSNSWPVSYRDESTNRPLAYSTRPDIDAAGWNVDPVADRSSSNPQTFGSGTQAHMPSAGFTAYLATGQWSHLETAAFWASRSHMQISPISRQRELSIPNGPSTEDRGRGWHIRSLAQIAAIWPDDTGVAADNLVRTDFVAALGGVFTDWAATNLGCPLGYIADMYNPGLYGQLPDLRVGLYQGHFITASVGYAWDLDVGLAAAARTAHMTVRDHLYKLPTGLAGTGSGWCYREAAFDIAVLGTYSAPTITWFNTWAEAWARMVARGEVTNSCPLNDALPAWALAGTGYMSNYLPSLTYAVHHGAEGAYAGLSRLSGASNWQTFLTNQQSNPEWAVEAPSLPSYVPAAGNFANVSTNTLSSVDPDPSRTASYRGISGQEAVFNSWNGGVYAPDLGQYGSLILHGGGHGDYHGNEVYGYDIATRTWSRLKDPYPNAVSVYTSPAGTDAQGAWPDGSPAVPHLYQGYLYMAPADGGGTNGSFVRVGWAAESVTGKWAWKFDLNTRTWSALADLTAINGRMGAAFDTTRRRWLVMPDQNSTSKAVYLSPNGSTVSATPGNNTDSGIALGYCPVHDLYVYWGRLSGANYIRVRAAGASAGTAWSTISITGSPSIFPDSGLEWSTILEAFVSYNAGDSSVWLLRPPTTSPLSNAWTWTSSAMTGVGGAVPLTVSASNGHWCRFREVPRLRCFIYADGRSNAVQLWRLQGM